jgi:glycosyltransferase involved in cell wall biosynthesis
MKISMVVENHPGHRQVSGGRYHALLVACGLVELGHDIMMLTQARPPFWGDFIPYYKMPGLRITTRPESEPASADLVIGYPIVWSESALALARRLGVPCWNVVLDAEPLAKQFAPAVASKMHFGQRHTRALGDSDLLLSISEHAAPHIKKWTGNQNVVGFMGCVNSRCADFISVQTENRWVTITRLSGHKRFDDLLRVVKKAGIALDVITSFNPRPMQSKIAAARLGGRAFVHYRPSDREKYMLLKSARAYVGASAYEGLGMPFMEAVYCGLPVVCYDYPVLREVCRGAALYARHSSPDSLAAKVSELNNDPFVLVTKSVAAYKVGKRYAFGAMCERLEDLLKKHVGQ